MWNAILTTPIKTFSLTFRKKLYGIESFSEIKSYLKSSSWHLERNLINTSQITIAKIPKQAIFFSKVSKRTFSLNVFICARRLQNIKQKLTVQTPGIYWGKLRCSSFRSQNGPKWNTISWDLVPAKFSDLNVCDITGLFSIHFW